MFPVKIETFPALTLAAVRHVGPYQEIGTAVEKLLGIFTSHDLMSHWAGMADLYRDNPDIVPAAELVSWAGVILADPDAFPAGIEGLEIVNVPAGTYAVMEHKGPYETLRDAYGWLYGTWLPNCGREMRDQPSLEVYLNDPRETAPEDLRTDVRVALV